jgi:hypothetical protein
MRGRRTVVLTVAILTSLPACASTQLPGAGLAGLGQDSAAASVRDASPFDALAREIFGGAWANKGADDEPFAVDENWFSRPSALSPTKHNPFAWTFLLIAFAGLTAVFARKPSGGSGLISA